MKVARLAAVSIAVAVLAMSGCKTESKPKAAAAPPGMMNTKCPFSGGAAKADVTSTYNGQTIGFCCNNCKGKFDAMTDEKKKEMVAKAK